jgi:cell division transport system permease protein
MSERATERSRPSGASRQAPRAALHNWLGQHARALVFTLGEVARAPFGSALTAAVIALALALPGGLYVVVDNAAQLGTGLDDIAQISLFLKATVNDDSARRLADRLRAHAGIASVRLISREEALAEFRRLSGLGDVQGLFGGENPLPAVLVLRTTAARADDADVHRLVREMEALPEVDTTQSDLDWLKRLGAVLSLARRLLDVLSVVLGTGVLLVVASTMRVALQGRRGEIEVARLCGATDAFIRRPFLYAGAVYGLFGSLLAIMVLGGTLAWLHGPLARLAQLYTNGFRLEIPGAWEVLTFVAVGVALGLGGAWAAVTRQLHSMEP